MTSYVFFIICSFKGVVGDVGVAGSAGLPGRGGNAGAKGQRGDKGEAGPEVIIEIKKGLGWTKMKIQIADERLYR